VTNENGAGSGCTYIVSMLLDPRPQPDPFGVSSFDEYLDELAGQHGLSVQQAIFDKEDNPQGILQVRFDGQPEGDPRCGW
jgi:hypothetical protein